MDSLAMPQGLLCTLLQNTHTVLFTQGYIKLKRPTSSALFLSLSFMTLSGDFLVFALLSRHTFSLPIACLLFSNFVFSPAIPEATLSSGAVGVWVVLSLVEIVRLFLPLFPYSSLLLH